MCIKKVRPDEEWGTSLTGYLDASATDIIKAFGNPEYGSSDGKVRYEWYLEADGIFFTIYDWKSRTPLDKERSWHIGSAGHCHGAEKLKDLPIIADAIKETIPGAKVRFA